MSQDATHGEVVATGGASPERKLGFFGRIALFLRQVVAELRKVVTPTRKELINYTIVVLIFVIIMMALVYGLDWVFSWLASLVFGLPSA